MGVSRVFSRARLAESEAGAIRKDWRGRYHIALIYPNTYAVGISNLGFQTVYTQLNDIPEIVCERAFLPEGGSDNWPQIRTLESGRPLSDYDLIAFSVSFENDYPNILSILQLAGLPLLAKERGTPHPLILGGGVACFLNPEPISPFFDVFLFGEAEALLPSFLTVLLAGDPREILLERIAKEVKGAYVPSFYRVEYGPDSAIASVTPDCGAPSVVKRVIEKDIQSFNTHSTILTPHGSFGSETLVEVSRGCPHGCRFCSAGYIYRPPRFRSQSQILTVLKSAAPKGYRAGLVGAAVSDLPFIEDLCREAGEWGIPLAFSSLRADRLTSGLISNLAKDGVKTATIAPDAGSERMRQVINKGITEKQILDSVGGLVQAGILNVKLYFMVGLPEETLPDVDAVVQLVKAVKAVFLSESRHHRRIGRISVSINGFVPKPVTPFQWSAMDSPEVLREKMARIKRQLASVANVQVKTENPKSSYLQAILSRGDRRVSQLLQAGIANGWNWPKTFRSWYMDPDFFATRPRPLSEILPWDFIDSGVRKQFLWSEYQNGLNAKPSPSCPMKPCAECRVCSTGNG